MLALYGSSGSSTEECKRERERENLEQCPSPIAFNERVSLDFSIYSLVPMCE